MRIAIGIPSLLRGGTEVQTLHLVKALLVSGVAPSVHPFDQSHETGHYHVTVVCYFETDPCVVGEFERAGAKVLLMGLDRSVSIWKFLWIVRKSFRVLRPDIIHIQYMAPGFLAVVAGLLATARTVVATVHQPWTKNHHGVKAKCLLRTAAWICKSFVCVSEAAELSWFGVSQKYTVGKRRATTSRPWRSHHFTIHNTIDMSQVDQILGSVRPTDLRGTLGLQPAIVIGAVSRLSGEKGIDVLLGAFAMVCKRLAHSEDAHEGALRNVESAGEYAPMSNLRVELVIVGDGPERVRLEERAVALGLYSVDYRDWTFVDHREMGNPLPTVVWLGKRTWEDSIKLMSVMDICVVPSRFEGFGLTAAEAMACGKPVVAADVGGLPEVVGRDNSCARLYAAGSVEGLAENLRELLLSKPKRQALGERGRARVETLFGFERFRESIRGLYKEMCDK